MKIEWLQIASPIVSLGGAFASWYWARRRLTWDAGKELGAFRAETIELISMALKVGIQTRHQVALPDFSKAHLRWRKQLDERAPTIGRSAYRQLLKLTDTVYEAQSQFVGLPLGGLEADERLYREDFDPEPLSADTEKQLSRILKHLVSDPHFMTR